MFGLVRRKEETAGDKRLVLGFDAGCVACSDLARRIGEQVGDKLEIRSLRDPQVQEWRRRALGEDAPWAPTLIEVKGLSVKAWTGLSMRLTLSRFLGPVGTWRLLQVLGGIGTSGETEESPVGVVPSLTRGQFIKGAAGVAAAISVVPGSALLASDAHTAQAQSDPIYDGLSDKKKPVTYSCRATIIGSTRRGC